MNLPQNLFNGNINAQVILCQADKTRIGEILPYDLKGTFKFNTYSEISFSIDKYYNDLLEGTTKINPYYDLIDSIRVIEIRSVGHFVIQDVDENEAENYTKSVTCYSLEYSTGQKYLENFYVNTGEEGSIETMYHSQQYGVEYSIDNYYTLVNKERDAFDPYQRYYIKQYSDDNNTTSYNYVEQQVVDKEAYNNGDFELYVKKYPNVRFYWPTNPELSLLHHIFSLIPEWKIGHVDKELWYQERTFSEDRTAIYDFLYNTAAETLKFVMVWDSINGTCSFYKTEEDGVIVNNYRRTNIYNPSFEYYSDDIGTKAEPQPTSEEDVINGVYYINVGQSIETQWDTDVFISRENLASKIDIKYSTDDIKTKLKIIGADTLDVRDVNLGQNYIINLSFYKDDLWMGPDLKARYDDYETLLGTKTKEYQQLMSEWSATYNEYSDLMNYVPVEPRVLLVEDPFDKLYCTYGITKAIEYVEDKKYYDINGKEVVPKLEDGNLVGDYYINTVAMNMPALKKKLGLYKVGIDDNGNVSKIDKTDDVLLTLTNENSDSVIIRVKCVAKAANKNYEDYEYEIVRTITNATTGYINTEYFELEDWVGGLLTAKEMKLSDSKGNPLFTVKSIGTLGAYLCLAKDETNKAEVEEYGIRLLQEKQDVYTKIFITQTEGYMSKEGSQCVAMDKEPEGQITVGSKWLDTSSSNATVYTYVGKDGDSYDGRWNVYSTDKDSDDFENYTRFIDNYNKLQVVQEVLKEKQYHADMLLNGIANNEFYIPKGSETENDLLHIALISLVLANNPYVKSISQPSSSYETEGMIWVQGESDVDILTATKFQYLNNQWVSYNPSIDTTITSSYIDNENGFGYLTFTVKVEDEDIEYAVYLSNGTPYISYARSIGLNSAKRDLIKTQTDMNTFFTKQELIRLSPFIREDEYSDDNFLLTGYESEEEEMYIKQELLNAGIKELNKISRPKLSFDMTIANILAIPEFAPLKNQFKLGNFVRVGIREQKDYDPERARLLEVQINFEDASDFSCTFGNLISTKSEVDKHADLLSMAVQAGKSVASNKSFWQKGADKATELDHRINNGLQDATLEVGRANNQSIQIGQNGIWGRKLIDGTTDQYEPEQFRLINNKLVFSSDGFKTSKAVFGKYTVNGETRWGPLAEYVTAETIEGKFLKGGKIQIGDPNNENGSLFVVNEDGSVEIKSNGQDRYVSKDALNDIDKLYKHRVVLSYNGSAVFAAKDDKNTTTITAIVYERKSDGSEDDITSTIDASNFTWIRSSPDASSDVIWNSQRKGMKQITITHEDVIENSHFSCQVDIGD